MSDYTTQKALDHFTPGRQSIIIKMAKMTRQELNLSTREAFLINDLVSDFAFQKKLNNALSKLKNEDLKCGAKYANYVSRAESDEQTAAEKMDCGILNCDPLLLLLAFESAEEKWGEKVNISNKSMACDLKITARHASRIKFRVAQIDKMQGDLWAGVAA